MSAVKAPQRKERPRLNSPVAGELLDQWCAERGVAASPAVSGLFAAAGSLSGNLAPQRRTLSSRLLLFAIADGAAVEAGTSDEAAVLAAAAELLGARRERLDEARTAYFTTAAKPELIEKADAPRLSPNVQRMLEAAAGSSSPIDALSLLLAFPPAGSSAEKLLREIGVAPDELHLAVQPKKPPPPQGGPQPSEPPNERVSTHADEPADVDELGRRAFADILADRIREARDSSIGPDPSAFIVHLHGPWGSGKTTVLNFLEANLSAPPESWIVVKFNAWRDQRLQPPWWRLITTIYAGARSKLGWRAPLLWLRWLSWRVRADYVPLIAVAAGVALLLLFWVWLAPDSAPPGSGSAGPMETMLKYATPLITVLGAIYVGSRALALGSRRAAQTYAELKDDPYKPIAKLFNDLVEAVGRPLVVFIDDLDRCDSKYVVELLEGIQTLMRGAPVTYVVAADRKWICSSFEQRYAGFSPPIGECGRPLGYLFLDKVFQISAAIPQIPSDVQSSFWARLLGPGRIDAEAQAEAIRQAEAQAERDVAGVNRQEVLQDLVRQAEASGDRARIQAVRAASAKRITSREAALHTEHKLQAFSALLEPNPRSMKRLVNAYAMHQATLLLAGRAVAAAALARWTILEMRWPLLADFLALRPECLDALRRPLDENQLPQVPTALRPLFGDELVNSVIGEAAEADRLTGAALKTILGAVQGDR